MAGDLIFVNIDPDFNTALQALGELEKETRLEMKNRQWAWLNAIQSNVDGDDNIFKFGGGTSKKQALAFGRTASAVFRMVMLRAVGIEKDFWPNLGHNTMKRNKEILQFKELTLVSGQDPFTLLDGAKEETVRRYCAKYDQVFPHFHISGKVSENEGKNVDFCNTMLIFRNKFTEVIIIRTDANATMYPSSYLGWELDSEFYSRVTVLCTRKIISKGKDNDGKYFTRLKERFSRAGQEQPQRMAKKKSEVLDQLKKDKVSNKDKEPKKDNE